jgi:hypothetical protein
MHSTNKYLQISAILSIIAMMVLCCSIPKRITEYNYQNVKIPPNCVKVTDHLYCDRSELGIIDYREYMFWMGNMFGYQSSEYISTIPDTLVWNYSGIDLNEPLSETYLRHPAYDFYPLVGITQQQALNYSKWRSDRVFQALLINMRKIEEDTIPNKETYFTIEKYFNGSYSKVLSEKKVKYYPDFRLPTMAERALVLHYADSIDRINLEKCRSKYCKDRKHDFPIFHIRKVPVKMENDYSNITIPVYNYFCNDKKEKALYNIRGNVSEWAAEPNITLGGGWHDQRTRILQSDTFHIDKPNAWTGFRNVCEWKEWKE